MTTLGLVIPGGAGGARDGIVVLRQMFSSFRVWIIHAANGTLRFLAEVLCLIFQAIGEAVFGSNS